MPASLDEGLQRTDDSTFVFDSRRISFIFSVERRREDPGKRKESANSRLLRVVWSDLLNRSRVGIQPRRYLVVTDSDLRLPSPRAKNSCIHERGEQLGLRLRDGTLCYLYGKVGQADPDSPHILSLDEVLPRTDDSTYVFDMRGISIYPWLNANGEEDEEVIVLQRASTP
ncbi:hypothetical protein C8F01DRAFT_1087086 [Mycena amicta]|nr:hypothetical protein C8F01DRAFT_1087086 [Mycena amicta]